MKNHLSKRFCKIFLTWGKAQATTCGAFFWQLSCFCWLDVIPSWASDIGICNNHIAYTFAYALTSSMLWVFLGYFTVFLLFCSNFARGFMSSPTSVEVPYLACIFICDFHLQRMGFLKLSSGNKRTWHLFESDEFQHYSLKYSNALNTWVARLLGKHKATRLSILP